MELMAYSIENCTPSAKIRIYKESLDKHSLLIGRNNSCGLTFKDISVSREHALLYAYEQNWYIADNNSKFGTL